MIKKCSKVLCVVALMLWGATAAEAQERGRTGLTIAYPASFGLIVHVSDRVAIRPDFSFSTIETESTLIGATIDSISESPTEGLGFNVGVSGLFDVGKWDNLRAYVGPGVSYTRSTLSLSTVTDSTTSGYAVTGFFGAQYTLGRKFGVFGEVGLGYRSATTSATTISVLPPEIRVETTTRGWSSRSGVGVVFYF